MRRLANLSPSSLLTIDLAIKVVTVALLGWAILNPDLPQFQGKAFAGRAIAYPVALLIIPLGWWVFGSRTIAFPVTADILFGLPFLIDVVGNALNLYDTIEWWDDANHLVNWALQTSEFQDQYRDYSWEKDTLFYATNGLWQVDYRVINKRSGQVESSVRTFFYDPNTQSGVLPR